MRKVKCRACGFKFEPEKEHVYAASFQSSEGKTFVMKVVDCPRCSCQRVLVPYFKPLTSYTIRAGESWGSESVVSASSILWRIAFSSHDEAQAVLDQVKDLLDVCIYISVADLKDLVGISPTPIDTQYGWFDYEEMSIYYEQHDFVLLLPMPSKLQIEDELPYDD